MPQQEVAQRAQEIWAEFLAEGAPSSINLDSHSYERTSQNLKDPGRYSYEDAQVEQITKNTTSDCIPLVQCRCLYSCCDRISHQISEMFSLSVQIKFSRNNMMPHLAVDLK